MAVETKSTETKPKIDFDQVKQAINQLTLLDILPIAIATINSLREFGEFVIAIGNLQQKSQSAYEVVLQVGGEPQAFLAVLVDKIPQEKLKPLVELSLEMGSIQSKLVDFAKLSSIEKVEIGEKLKEAARKMSTILQEMRT